jgi:hypothetical protein
MEQKSKRTKEQKSRRAEAKKQTKTYRIAHVKAACKASSSANISRYSSIQRSVFPPANQNVYRE